MFTIKRQFYQAMKLFVYNMEVFIQIEPIEALGWAVDGHVTNQDDLNSTRFLSSTMSSYHNRQN